MSIREGEQRFRISPKNKPDLKYLKKAVSTLFVLIIGVAGFYLLPGNWAALSFAVTPILLFTVLFGRYFKDNVLSDSDSHAPLITLGAIYMGMCWFIIANAH